MESHQGYLKLVPNQLKTFIAAQADIIEIPD